MHERHTYIDNSICSPSFLLCDWPGASVHGDDDPSDDHSSADAADSLPSTAAGSAPAATGPNAATGNIVTHTNSP